MGEAMNDSGLNPQPGPPTRRRKTWPLVLLVVLVGLFLAYRAAQTNRPFKSNLPWQSDASAALAEAKAKGLPVLMVFSMPNCVFCTQLQQDVLSKPAFENVARGRVVLADLDIAARKQNLQLLQRYGGTGTPTVVLTNADGRLLGFYNGGSLPDWLAGLLGGPAATTAPEAASAMPGAT
jgi:thioredoxin-related protein